MSETAESDAAWVYDGPSHIAADGGWHTGTAATCPDCNDVDPYDQPVYIKSRIPRLSHMHSEPVCVFPECETYLTREGMAAMQARVTPPESSTP